MWCSFLTLRCKLHTEHHPPALLCDLNCSSSIASPASTAEAVPLTITWSSLTANRAMDLLARFLMLDPPLPIMTPGPTPAGNMTRFSTILMGAADNNVLTSFQGAWIVYVWRYLALADHLPCLHAFGLNHNLPGFLTSDCGFAFPIWVFENWGNVCCTSLCHHCSRIQDQQLKFKRAEGNRSLCVATCCKTCDFLDMWMIFGLCGLITLSHANVCSNMDTDRTLHVMPLARALEVLRSANANLLLVHEHWSMPSKSQPTVVATQSSSSFPRSNDLS